MYRNYEDPYALESQLEKLQQYVTDNPEDVDAVIELHELRDRVNYAWQDAEYDSLCEYDDEYDYLGGCL